MKAGGIVKFCFGLKQDLSVKLACIFVCNLHLLGHRVKPSRDDMKLGNLQSLNKLLHNTI
jgi:hypothetical protein